MLSALMHVIAAFAAVTLALVAIDLLWLSVIARRPGRRGSGRMFVLPDRVGVVVSGLLGVGLLLVAINPAVPVEAAAPPPLQQYSPALPVVASAPT